MERREGTCKGSWEKASLRETVSGAVEIVFAKELKDPSKAAEVAP